MTTQINLKFQDNFYKLTEQYAESKGYMSVQELVREALRDKIFEDMDVRKEYRESLESNDATTFLSEEDSETFLEELKQKSNS
ncbi:MAG: hypothetical protein ACLFPL_03210 [Candidatus Nanoarchaeia archaeon]